MNVKLEKSILFSVVIAVLALFVSGCATQRPLLYPNEHLKNVGKEQAQKDIDDAMKQADEYDLESSDKQEQAGKTVTHSAVGAGTGAAVGAVTGNPVTGAVSGAAGGASSGILTWIFGTHKPPEPYRKFVETYLKKKGYEIIGWK